MLFVHGCSPLLFELPPLNKLLKGELCFAHELIMK